ncbi:putative adenylylsulfate kinase [Myxococcus xanthus DK 1622]|uniref:Adenylyl-sulfate kinase n=2 Tax=Myxococcus xanthus TaxID=34 RepID=Q1D531_MYXXD|nr:MULTISPECIES: adenylyl-sulfate kinase [Myxococcus]ABF92028.1 putative adenylylsulfate kinase [Myxococcus xanthus DK 1622]NOJ51510.1 adenylyl-sulfate kinase [Myxococcus xanthus]NOJ82252.1 adenylyl-sulfate kinase [Myxococcus xanthus]NOJ89836.1 adenylyl-sulfate kinase [Myxococcus xanthus]QPM76683.1 adenylyl-sulfate kinase [Myxococcus xanthus]
MASNTGFTLWLTGMSGTGKSTTAAYIAARLRQVGRNVEILDEGELGEALWAGLGDGKEDRITVVKRLGFVANLLTRNGVAALVPCVSPYKPGREENRRSIGRYVEVYVDCPTEKLIERDSTGRYKKALNGEIPNFIGITEPYEPPNSPEVTIHSNVESVEDGAAKIFQSLLDLGYMSTEELKVITGKKMKANPLPAKGEKAEKAEKGGAKARRAEESKPAAKAPKADKGAKARPATRAARVAKPAAAAKKAAKRKAR